MNTTIHEKNICLKCFINFVNVKDGNVSISFTIKVYQRKQLKCINQCNVSYLTKKLMNEQSNKPNKKLYKITFQNISNISFLTCLLKQRHSHICTSTFILADVKCYKVPNEERMLFTCIGTKENWCIYCKGPHWPFT